MKSKRKGSCDPRSAHTLGYTPTHRTVNFGCCSTLRTSRELGSPPLLLIHLRLFLILIVVVAAHCVAPNCANTCALFLLFQQQLSMKCVQLVESWFQGPFVTGLENKYQLHIVRYMFLYNWLL